MGTKIDPNWVELILAKEPFDKIDMEALVFEVQRLEKIVNDSESKIQSLESKLATAVEALELHKHINFKKPFGNDFVDIYPALDALTSIRSDEGGEEKK